MLRLGQTGRIDLFVYLLNISCVENVELLKHCDVISPTLTFLWISLHEIKGPSSSMKNLHLIYSRRIYKYLCLCCFCWIVELRISGWLISANQSKWNGSCLSTERCKDWGALTVSPITDPSVKTTWRLSGCLTIMINSQTSHRREFMKCKYHS